MAEIGAIGSIVGIAVAAAQTSRIMYEIAREIRSASEDVEGLAISIEAWSAVLYMAHEALNGQYSIAQEQDRRILHKITSKKVIGPIVNECEHVRWLIDKTTPQLEAFLDSMTWFMRIKWLFMKGEVDLLSRRMESSKSTLMVVLQSVHLALNTDLEERKILGLLLKNSIETARIQQARLEMIDPDVSMSNILKTNERLFRSAKKLLPESRTNSRDGLPENLRVRPTNGNTGSDEPSRAGENVLSVDQDRVRRVSRRPAMRPSTQIPIEVPSPDLTEAGPSGLNTNRQVPISSEHLPPNNNAETGRAVVIEQPREQVREPQDLGPSTYSAVHRTNHTINSEETNQEVIQGRIHGRQVQAMIVPQFSDSLMSEQMAVDLGLKLVLVHEEEHNEPYYFNDGPPEPKIGDVRFEWRMGHRRAVRVRCSVCQRRLPFLYFGQSYLERCRKQREREGGDERS